MLNLQLPNTGDEPITVYTRKESTGDIVISIQKGNTVAEILRITVEGRVAKIVSQTKAIKEIGFHVGEDGCVYVY